MSLRDIIRRIATARGIILEDPRPGDPEHFMRFRVPAQRDTLDLDEQLLSVRLTNPDAVIALLDREVTGMQRRMFRATTDHIATHDRDPLDRLKQIETAARALLDALGPVGFSRTDGPLTKAALDLEQLLRAKPGAVSWQRDGYGKDSPRGASAIAAAIQAAGDQKP